MDVVEFVADAFAHRKQVHVKKLYNQVPQTAWVCSARVAVAVGVRDRQTVISGQFELKFQSHLEIGCPRSENQLQTEGPGWAAQQNEEEELRWSEELGVNMWQSLSVSNSPLTHNQHQPFRNPFENKVWEVYFSKEVCSFVHWSCHVSAYIRIYYVYVYMYGCDYKTLFLRNIRNTFLT